MLKLKYLLLLVILKIAVCDNRGTFTVVGRDLFEFRGNYRASVAYHGYEKESVMSMKVMLLEDKSTGKQFEVAHNVTLLGSGVHHVNFDLKDQLEGPYVLEVICDDYSHPRKLHKISQNKKSSTFIQTDKAIYKPSDLVQFRILLLDAETKPFILPSTSKIDIFITDGGDNRVKQFDNPKFNSAGVFQNELQLSDQPVLGKWKLHIKIDDSEETVKDFEVAEYVLPKFEVKIEANPDANFKDGKIRATVNAKYTFGKEAKGKVIVTAEVEKNYWGRRTMGKEVSKTVQLNGKEIIEFDIKEEIGIDDNSHRLKVILTAVFTEELSGKEVKAETSVQIHPTRHKIKLIKEGDEKIKPGIPYKVTANVQLHDRDMPVTDNHNPVIFDITYYYDILQTCKQRVGDNPRWKYRRGDTIDLTNITYQEVPCKEEKSYVEQTELFLKDGKASVEIEIKENITKVNIKAKYLDIHDQFQPERAESATQNFIQAKLISKASLYEPMTVEVISNDKITEITYQILGKSTFTDAKIITFPSTKKHTFTFKPTPSMLPKSKVIVYYVALTGEIISDHFYIEFGSASSNFIDLKLSKETAKPGENVNISVSTKPNSFVGLLGVDQSVLLLKSGNDIDSSVVEREIKSDEVNVEWNDESYLTRDPEKINIKLDDFTDYYGPHDHVLIMTNAIKQFNKKWIRGVFDDEEEDRLFMESPEKYDDDHHHNLKMVPYSGNFVSAKVDIESSLSLHMMEDRQMPTYIRGFVPKAKPIEIRKEFPETWLFDNLEFDSGPNATKILSKKVPDTITSWIITGFNIDSSTGLGLTKQPTKLNVFQSFFVTTNLPYSIKRGEVVSVPLVVFNYLDIDQTALVTLFNKDQEFEFVEVNDEENQVSSRNKRALESERTKTVEIKSNEGKSISFMIRPLKVGSITIKVTAESDMAGDGIEKQLRVEPEGVTQYKNEAVFMDLRSEEKFNREIEIVVPENAVEDSTRIEASAMGDILGPTIENLNKLIRMPYGCGEQNMLNFVPNIIVLEYLTNLDKLTPEVEERCKKYMEVGYQKELTYMHADGSYSAFGKSDRSGSTWLTAYFARSFYQATKFIHIDKEKVSKALNFLAKVQTENGSFSEVGYMLDKNMQGGSSKGIALTAYTLITFLENKEANEMYKETISKALNYIVDNLDQLDDNYSLAIASYALQLAKHEKRDELLAKLNSKAEAKDGVKYWMKEQPKNEESDRWYRKQVNSVNVEMSAYALLALLESEQDTEAVSVMKWLVSQRNANGGFQSTQDTVVGLQALSKLATKIYVPESDIKVTIKSNGNTQTQMNLNTNNALLLQKHRLPSNQRNFEIEATGHGFSILQISYKYNIDDSAKFPRFTLQPKVESASNKEFLQLSVCTAFVPNSEASKSNMAVMEVALPSGFTFDTDSLDELMETERVKKVETRDGETIVLMYFDDIDSNELCPQIKAYRTHAVAKQKPSPVVIYDYYDNTRHARAFYNPPEISLCDICNGEDECKDDCEVPTVEI